MIPVVMKMRSLIMMNIQSIKEFTKNIKESIRVQHYLRLMSNIEFTSLSNLMMKIKSIIELKRTLKLKKNIKSIIELKKNIRSIIEFKRTLKLKKSIKSIIEPIKMIHVVMTMRSLIMINIKSIKESIRMQSPVTRICRSIDFQRIQN